MGNILSMALCGTVATNCIFIACLNCILVALKLLGQKSMVCDSYASWRMSLSSSIQNFVTEYSMRILSARTGLVCDLWVLNILKVLIGLQSLNTMPSGLI